MTDLAHGKEVLLGLAGVEGHGHLVLRGHHVHRQCGHQLDGAPRASDASGLCARVQRDEEEEKKWQLCRGHSVGGGCLWVCFSRGLKINLNSFRQSKEGRDDDVVNVEAWRFWYIDDSTLRFDLLYGSIVPSRITFREKKVRFFVTTEPFKGSIVPK